MYQGCAAHCDNYMITVTELVHLMTFRTSCHLTRADLRNNNTKELTSQCGGAQYFQHCRLSLFFAGL